MQTLNPTTVVYSYQEPTTGSTANCDVNKSNTVYSRPIGGGERVESATAPLNTAFLTHDINQGHIAAVTADSCGTGQSEQIWHSADGGKTFQSVYTGQKPAGSDTLQEQITSIKLASDNTSLVFGSLDGNTFKNTIKEINLETKAVTDIKQVADDNGVFIQGYNKPAQTLYYYTGCFGCDGGSLDKLLAYNTGTATESTVVDQSNETTIGLEARFNADFSKVLTVRGATTPELLGGGAPYTVQEYDLTQKTTKTIATIKSEQYRVGVGYTADEQLPYYVEDKNVLTVATDGKTTVVFESTAPIFELHYLSKQFAVVSSGVYENFTTVAYDYATKKAATILTGDAESTLVFGVGLQ